LESILIISSIVLWIVVLFNIFLTLALVRRLNSPEQYPRHMPETLEIGTDAPDFVVETLSGNVVKRENLNSNEIAMVFVSPDCSACHEHLPKLQELYPKAKLSGVELMVISISDTGQTNTYAKELDFTAPIYSAKRDINSLAKDYKVPGTPSYYIIDRNSKIKAGGFFDDSWDQAVREWSNNA